jgi:hypothetical protein
MQCCVHVLVCVIQSVDYIHDVHKHGILGIHSFVCFVVTVAGALITPYDLLLKFLGTCGCVQVSYLEICLPDAVVS